MHRFCYGLKTSHNTTARARDRDNMEPLSVPADLDALLRAFTLEVLRSEVRKQKAC